MRIDPAGPAGIYEVAMRMRERDFEEISALMSADTREAVAEALTERYGGRDDILAVSKAGEAVCIGALVETRPNVVSALFFATERFPEVALPLTRFIRRELFPRFKAAGIHRIEASSLCDYRQMHRWLRVLGLSQETPPLAGFGKRGESFVQFAWSSYAGSPGS